MCDLSLDSKSQIPPQLFRYIYGGRLDSQEDLDRVKEFIQKFQSNYVYKKKVCHFESYCKAPLLSIERVRAITAKLPNMSEIMASGEI